MSYCRKGQDGSQVYARYDSEEMRFLCEDCDLSPSKKFSADKPDELLAHLHAHVAAGHSVPDYAFSCLSADAAFLAEEHP